MVNPRQHVATTEKVEDTYSLLPRVEIYNPLGGLNGSLLVLVCGQRQAIPIVLCYLIAVAAWPDSFSLQLPHQYRPISPAASSETTVEGSRDVILSQDLLNSENGVLRNFPSPQEITQVIDIVSFTELICVRISESRSTSRLHLCDFEFRSSRVSLTPFG